LKHLFYFFNGWNPSEHGLRQIKSNSDQGWRQFSAAQVATIEFVIPQTYIGTIARASRQHLQRIDDESGRGSRSSLVIRKSCAQDKIISKDPA
jgi:hypothetical protein